ncbi:MAG: YIP1 family protein, partial [Archaeoglobaceae archaeon]
MDVLLNPDKFFMENKEMGFKIPIAIVLVSAMTSAILAYSATQSILEKIQIEQGGLNLLSLLSALAGVSAVLVTFLTWIVLTAILYFLSAIFKGKGDFLTLMKFLAFSFIPSIVLSPVNLYLSLELLRS